MTAYGGVPGHEELLLNHYLFPLHTYSSWISFILVTVPHSGVPLHLHRQEQSCVTTDVSPEVGMSRRPQYAKQAQAPILPAATGEPSLLQTSFHNAST